MNLRVYWLSMKQNELQKLEEWSNKHRSDQIPIKNFIEQKLWRKNDKRKSKLYDSSENERRGDE